MVLYPAKFCDSSILVGDPVRSDSSMSRQVRASIRLCSCASSMARREVSNLVFRSWLTKINEVSCALLIVCGTCGVEVPGTLDRIACPNRSC